MILCAVTGFATFILKARHEEIIVWRWQQYNKRIESKGFFNSNFIDKKRVIIDLFFQLDLLLANSLYDKPKTERKLKYIKKK